VALGNTSSNGLLQRLIASDRALLTPHLRPVKLKLRQCLEQANRRVRAAYFIESGLASVVAVSRDRRRQAEVAIIGREGMTGVTLVLGAERSSSDLFMQVEGSGQCIAASDLRTALTTSKTLSSLLSLYAHSYFTAAAHTSLANAQGRIDERLARWLLMAQDRLESDRISLTHEFFALMLGTRRAGVTTAVSSFHARGLISHSRGVITILDREGLESAAGGLYGIPETEYARIFEPISSQRLSTAQSGGR
jgi:CRP-like cAMP-binding protein